MTISFKATTSITSGSVFVTFPTGFDITSASFTQTGATIAKTNQVAELKSVNVSNSSTNTFVIGAVTTPSTVGGYGPFKIVTRKSTNGQIIDANYSFGSVGIAAAPGSISSLALAWASNGTGMINLSSQSINFTFTISNDLWKHDMFVLTFPKEFTVTSSVGQV